MLFGMRANLSVNQECDSGPGMTINLLGSVASLEEIEGSVVFPPKYLPPAPSVINSWRYLMGALHPSIVKHETHLANIPQAVRPSSTVPWEQIASGQKLFSTTLPMRIQAILQVGEAPLR